MNAITSPHLIESFSFDSIPDVVTLENTFKSLSTSFGSYSGDIRSKLDEVMLGMDISNEDEIKIKLQRMTRTLVSIAELERYEKKESSYGLTDPQELAIMGMVPFLVQSLGDDGLPGTILMPTGQGKTRIPVVFQDITRGKIIYVANDTNGIEQMRSEHEKSRITGTIGLVHKDSESTEGLVIATFEGFKKAVSEGRIDIAKYDMIFIDEADVNGLSKKRIDFMGNLQKTFSIPVVALSATEQQASGRNLDDFYTYDILNLPMPQSLPDLCRKGLLPKTRFTDVYLDADFTVSKKDISSGLQDEVLDSILDKQSDWFQNMIDHHLDHYAGKPCIFAFRNNKFNNIFVELANASGLKLATFTGNETKDERDVLKKAFEKGELHGLVGSKMIGR